MLGLPQLLLITNYNNILVPTFENKKNKYIANIYSRLLITLKAIFLTFLKEVRLYRYDLWEKVRWKVP